MNYEEQQRSADFIQAKVKEYRKAKEQGDNKTAETLANGIALQAMNLYNYFINI